MTPKVTSHPVVVVSFDLSYQPRPQAQTFTSSEAPFDSGTWSLTPDFAAETVQLKFENVRSTVAVRSVTLKTGNPTAGALHNCSTDSGITLGSQFPLFPDGTMECQLLRALGPSWCRIEVILARTERLPVRVSPSGPVAPPRNLSAFEVFHSLQVESATDQVYTNLTQTT
jgi:hypothetical protein